MPPTDLRNFVSPWSILPLRRRSLRLRMRTELLEQRLLFASGVGGEVPIAAIEFCSVDTAFGCLHAEPFEPMVDRIPRAPLSSSVASLQVQLGATTPAEFTQERTLFASTDTAGVIWDAAALTDGTYVVGRLEPQGGEIRVVTERFSSSGVALGEAATWATYGDISSTEPMGLALTGLANGDFVVAWSRGDGIYVRQATSLNEPVGNVVHIADAAMSGEELDLLETSDSTLFLVWSNYARTAILGQTLGTGLTAQSAPFILMESPAGQSVSNPLLVAHPFHSFGLRWTEGAPYLPDGGSSNEPPDRFGGTTGPDYRFQFQLFDASGTASGTPIGLGANPTGIAPGVAVSPWGDFATAEMQWVDGETVITLNLRNAAGQINTTHELSRSRFVGFTAPHITMLPGGGFVVTYGTPFADGPLIQSQQYNASALPIGDTKQFNVGDDVGFPPELRVLPLSDFTYAVVWPHQLLTDSTSSLSSRTTRLATTPLEISLPADILASINSPTDIVRVSGVPASAELTAGSLAPDGSWYLKLEQLAGLHLVGDGPWTSSIWTIELLDSETTEVYYSEIVWTTTPEDDIIAHLTSTFAYYGGEGNDTFVVPFQRDELDVIRIDEHWMEVRESDSGLALWQLTDFERIRFSDISLPVEWLLHELPLPDSYTYTTLEDTMLSTSPSDGVLSHLMLSLPVHPTVYLIDDAHAGELALSTSGAFIYTPATNWHGTDTWLVDTRSMVFQGPIAAERNGDYFVADQAAGMPTMEFSALPNDLQDGHEYTVTFDIVQFEGTDVAFEFALIGGSSLVASELNSTEITAGTSGMLTFHFVKEPAHAGFTFNSTASSTESNGRLRFTNFQVTDTTTNEIVVNSSIADHWPRQIAVVVNAVADLPIMSVQADVGAAKEPILVTATADLADHDGSEVLRLTLVGIPAGGSITDGVHLATSGNATEPIDVTLWNTTQLQIALPANFRETFALTANATTTELSNFDSITSSQTLLLAPEYDDPPVDDPPIDNPPIDDSDEDDSGEGDADGESGPTFPGILATMFASSGGPSSWEGGGDSFPLGNGSDWNLGDMASTLDAAIFGNFSTIYSLLNDYGAGGTFGANSASAAPNGSAQSPAEQPQSEGEGNPGVESPLDGDSIGEESSDDNNDSEKALIAVPGTADVASDASDGLSGKDAGGLDDLMTTSTDDDEQIAAPSGITPQNESNRSLVDAAFTSDAAAPDAFQGVEDRHVDTTATQTYIVHGNVRVPAIFAAETLWRKVDDVTHGLETTTVAANVAVGSAVIVASGFSAAQVLWLLRGSVLATKLMSSMPVWIAFDPLPVLDAQTARRGKRKNPLSNESLADIASSH